MLFVIKSVAGGLFAIAAVLIVLAIFLIALILGFLWLYDLYCIVETAKEERRRIQQRIDSQQFEFEKDKIAEDEYFLMFQTARRLVADYKDGLPLDLTADEILDLIGAYLYARERYAFLVHPRKIARDDFEIELFRIVIALTAGTK